MAGSASESSSPSHSGHSAWKPKSPACLNCTPEGFTPWTANLFLIGANFDYYWADAIVPPLRAIGIDTPNKITYVNCVFRAFCLYALFVLRSYFLVTVVLILTQVLDCADGQCARRYGLGSAFGAWLDHTTDTLFGAAFAVVGLSMIGSNCGVYSVPFVAFATALATIGLLGRHIIAAKEAGKRYQDFTLLEVAGMYQELYMSWVYIVLMAIFTLSGALP